MLLATVGASGMAFLDGTVVNVALPQIGDTFDTDMAGLQWIINGYLVATSALILLGGSLGDLLGRRRVFLFAGASVSCALAANVWMLVLSRVVQGVGGALLTPGSLAILEASFRQEDRGRAIGAWSGLTGVVSALGPLGLGPTTLVGDCARSTVAAMRATGVRRLLVVGVAVLFENDGLLNAIARRTFLRNVARDSAEMEHIVSASGLDWTIARPPRLTDGVLTRAYGVADGRMPPAARLTISRADVADFLLDELEHSAHIRHIIGLASVKAAARRMA